MEGRVVSRPAFSFGTSPDLSQWPDCISTHKSVVAEPIELLRAVGEAADTHLARVASDHRPLIVDLHLRE
jgi:hypothetical protein